VAVNDPIVTLAPTELTVEPGAQVRAELTVRNPGSVVEEYRLEVLGELADEGPPRWAQIYPPTLKVYPKETGTATLVFAPPNAASAAIAASGRFPFGVRVVSTLTEDRDAPTDGKTRSTVAEGDLEVGRVFGLQATIKPMTSTGRWRGYHVLRYTNWGNAPVHLQLRASDPDERLGFLLQPTEVDVTLGSSAEARLKVRTRKPFLRGSPARLPFEVVADPEGAVHQPPAHPMASDPKRPAVSGAFLQKPIISRITVAIAALVVAALIGAIVLALKQPKSKQTFASEGPPDPPTGITAAAVANGKIKVDWQAAHAVESYKLLTVQGSAVVGTTTIDGQQTQFVTVPLAPLTRYCFSLESVRGSIASSPSSPACAATTAAAPASQTPSSAAPSGTTQAGGASGSGSGTPSGGATSSSGQPSSSGAVQSSPGGTLPPGGIQPGEWIVVFATYLDANGNAKQNAASAASGLSSSFAAQTLHSTDYPNWNWNGGKIIHPFWAVYVDTKALDATNQMLVDCRSRGFSCVATQPSG
jgi:hypothetical protein